MLAPSQNTSTFFKICRIHVYRLDRIDGICSLNQGTPYDYSSCQCLHLICQQSMSSTGFFLTEAFPGCPPPINGFPPLAHLASLAVASKQTPGTLLWQRDSPAWQHISGMIFVASIYTIKIHKVLTCIDNKGRNM